MSEVCCVKWCQKQYSKFVGISFHCFPKEEFMRQQWLNSLGLSILNCGEDPRVCSRHFTKDDFIVGGDIIKLKEDAIPTSLFLPVYVLSGPVDNCQDNALPAPSDKIKQIWASPASGGGNVNSIYKDHTYTAGNKQSRFDIKRKRIVNCRDRATQVDFLESNDHFVPFNVFMCKNRRIAGLCEVETQTNIVAKNTSTS